MTDNLTVAAIVAAAEQIKTIIGPRVWIATSPTLHDVVNCIRYETASDIVFVIDPSALEMIPLQKARAGPSLYPEGITIVDLSVNSHASTRVREIIGEAADLMLSKIWG